MQILSKLRECPIFHLDRCPLDHVLNYSHAEHRSVQFHQNLSLPSVNLRVGQSAEQTCRPSVLTGPRRQHPSLSHQEICRHDTLLDFILGDGFRMPSAELWFF
ncbi:hypothetical protein PoB_007478300 [Plakobranchus ocellatus]|uniref:Uncharacterized protein n=1 Tax=Plakobranchus ocellatus TaxID=259542 RepID=A0AAV4DW21_9GAST|nr:hypothetical protein PoB_007478300 [Plakobranchus ocellatus]